MDAKTKKGLLFAVFFSLCFMVFLLYRIEWKHFSLIAERMNIVYLIIAYVIFVLSSLIRTIRFRRLDHMDNKLTRWWHINQCYNLIIATLPGAPGEAVTAYVLKKYLMFKILGALRILVLARLMDLAVVAALFFFAAVQVGIGTPYRKAAIWFSSILCIVSTTALVPAIEQFILRMMQKIPGRSLIINKLCEKLNELVEISEEQQMRNAMWGSLLMSVLFITGLAVSVYFALKSFGVTFSFVQGLYCFGAFSVFKMFPVQGIAGIGTQAAWWTLALNTSGYQGPDTIAMGFVMYGTYYLFIALTGIPSVFILLRGRKQAAVL